jgi:hypothetical protein
VVDGVVCERSGRRRNDPYLAAAVSICQELPARSMAGPVSAGLEDSWLLSYRAFHRTVVVSSILIVLNRYFNIGEAGGSQGT